MAGAGAFGSSGVVPYEDDRSAGGAAPESSRGATTTRRRQCYAEASSASPCGSHGSSYKRFGQRPK